MVNSIIAWIIILYVALLFVIILINVLIFYRNMKPLYNLLHWLDHYKLGEKNEPLRNETHITEFRKLNEAALRYARRSEELYEKQKEFIGNASHEIQTPLAICRNRLEMLLEEDGLTEYQMGELIKIHRTLENLTRLNRSLLLLCKIENGQFHDIRPVVWNQLFRQYMDDYREVYAYMHIQIDIDESGTFECLMSETLASTLLTNLLKNAFVHNIQNGFIRISISKKCFSIWNSGASAPLDVHSVFNRFYHSHTKEGSTGLGLSLVQAICRLYGLEARYRYENNAHGFEISNS